MLTPRRQNRPLTPQDLEIIRLLGIKPSEYRRFLHEVERQARLRPIEGPVAFEITTAFVINLIIGLVSTALSFILAPRSQAARSPRVSTDQVDGQDIVRTDRFAAKNGFDSFQNVVELGSIIPLVYAKREVIGGVSYGGIRVNANLIWSQMLSLGGGQLFRGVYMLGQGGIQSLDPLQFALGDNLLSGYGVDLDGLQTAKVTFYSRLNGGRLVQGDYISGRQASEDDGNFMRGGASDIYQVPDHANAFRADASSAARPSNQTRFGLYSPIPSCMTFRVNPSFRSMWQPQTVARNEGRNFVIICNRDLQIQTDRWRDQSALSTRISFPSKPDGTVSLAVGEEIELRISKATDADHAYKLEEDTKNNVSTGDDDGRNALAETSLLSAAQTIASRQEAADDAIAIGERYLIGTAVGICVSRDSTPFVSNSDFPDIDGGSTVNASFRIITAGEVSNQSPWSQTSETAPVRGPLLTATNRMQVFRLAVASVTLGRKARVIEVGIKSTLGIRINGLMNFRDTWSLRRVDRRACLKYQYDPDGVKPPGVTGVDGVDGWPVYKSAKGVGDSTVNVNIEESFVANGTADSGGVVTTTGNISVSEEFNVQDPPDDQPSADFFRNVQFQNGTINSPAERYSFWLIRYRKAGGDQSWTTLDNLYGSRGSTQQPIYNYIRIAFPSFDDWEWDLVPVSGWQARNKTTGNMYVLDYKMGEITVTDGTVVLRFKGEQVARTRETFRISFFENTTDIGFQQDAEGNSGNVYPAVVSDTINGDTLWNYVDGWDKLAEIFMYEEISTSAQAGPEHEIVYVNIFETNDTTPQYDNLAIVGMNLRAGTEIQQLNQLSAYVLAGLNNTHLFPEIYQDMLTNSAYASKGVLPLAQVNTASFASAATFNYDRRYFCDMALSDPVNRRTWGQQVAPYFLLDVVTRNGQINLEPVFNFTNPEPITSLFTAGNIVEDSLEISTTDLADRGPVQVSVRWRQERQSSVPGSRGLFPLIRELTVRRSDTPENAQLVRIDMTDYCTSQQHAIDAAKLQCLVPVVQKRTCRFRTWPRAGSIIPGRCFQLGVEFIDYNAPANGVIGFDGTVTSWPPMADGTYDVVIWTSGSPTITTQSLVIADGKASPAGAVFAVQQSVSSKLTFKALRVNLNEDAEVEVEGVEFPLNSSGISVFADYFNDGLWVVEGQI